MKRFVTLSTSAGVIPVSLGGLEKSSFSDAPIAVKNTKTSEALASDDSRDHSDRHIGSPIVVNWRRPSSSLL